VILTIHRARAACATSPFFKHFRKAETGVGYIDGGVVDSCPVTFADREADLLWRGLTGVSPDIVLSLGAGLSLTDGPESLSHRLSHFSRERSRAESSTNAAKDSSASADSPITGIRIKGDKLSMDRAWHQFNRDKLRQASSSTKSFDGTFVRLNPIINAALPGDDDIRAMDKFEGDVEDLLQHHVPEIQETAHKLVASSFFFERDQSSIKQTSAGLRVPDRYSADLIRRPW
jgi:predicted acylesterase/phospholipase RssA